MGRLAGFRYREVARRLRKLGYAFDPSRAAMKSGEIPPLAGKSPCPATPRDLVEGTLRAILREARIEVDEFLGAGQGLDRKPQPASACVVAQQDSPLRVATPFVSSP